MDLVVGTPLEMREEGRIRGASRGGGACRMHEPTDQPKKNTR